MLKYKYKLLSLLSVSTFISIWHIVAVYNPQILPVPTDVLKELWRVLFESLGPTSLLGHIYWSLRRVFLALLIALLTGFPLALWMGWSRKVDAFFKPIFEALRPIPPIAWVPILILWFGTAEVPKVAVCYVGAVVPIILNTYAGIRYSNNSLLRASLILGANKRQQFFDVALPWALPAIFVGFQNGLSASWMSVLAAEMIGARAGLGFMILRGMDLGNRSLIIAGMIATGIVGALLASFIFKLERRICPWLDKTGKS